MKVTYFGQKDQVRMEFRNIAHYSNTNGVMELCTEVAEVPEHSPRFVNFPMYNTVVLINLAPGEYLEWSKDAERD